ncbi:Lactococcin A immunity protein (fragment) [Oenococcus oeni]
MSVFSKKNKTKKTVKEDELFADVQKALAGSPASEEVPILQEAEQALV